MLRMRPSSRITSPGSVYMARSNIHGRGVFAARRFLQGDVVEECPILAVTGDQAPLLDETDLYGFTFEWHEGVAVALGFGSLYNHSWTPNARYDHDYDRGLVVYSAVTTIARDDEITVNYSGDPDGRMELWFDAPGRP